MDEKALDIYKTSDLEKFKFFIGNRNLTFNTILENEIINNNKLKFNPILVDQDFVVIDGQHRLEIAKKNNLDIYYIIDEDAKYHDAISLNIGRKNWTNSDYLNYYCKLGYENYIFTKKIIDKYKLNLFLIIDFLGKVLDNKRPPVKFRNGTFLFAYTFSRVEQICSQLKDIQTQIHKYVKKANKNLDRCLIMLINEPDYDHERFIHKLNIYPDLTMDLPKYNRAENIYDLINRIYNMNSKKSKVSLFEDARVYRKRI